MNTFYLIRHGQPLKRKSNPKLNLIGRQQARKTAEYFKNKNIHKIFTSPKNRTLETAQIMADILYLDLEIIENLQERMDWNDYPNLTLGEFFDLWNYHSKNRSIAPKKGTSSFEAGKRLEKILNGISKKYPNKNIIIISHGGIISDFLRNILSDTQLLKYKSDLPELKDKQCSITIIKQSINGFTTKTIGSIEHLK